MKIKTTFHLILFILFYFPVVSFSQISIQFTSVNEYLFNTRESLNFSVISSNSKSVQVQFSGRITQKGNGEVVEFKTEPVTIQPGSNIFNPRTISLNDIQYINHEIEEIEQKTGTYPSGTYTVCIWSACTRPDCDGSGQSAGSIEQPVCLNIQVENPTPLLLSYPSDNSEIVETRPTYTWIPPAPVASSDALNYTMTLVEIYDGQSKTDALSLNRPLIEYTGLTNPMLMHPSDLPALEEGKSYAWQVQAFVGQTYFAKSEQWRFKVKKEIVKKDTVKYALITRNIDAGMHRVSEDGFLYFIYRDEKPNYTLNCSLLDSKMKPISGWKLESAYFDTITLKERFHSDKEFQSEGKYRTDISSLNLPSGIYYLEVMTSRKEKLYIKFQVD